MINCILVACAQFALIDKQTGALSVISIWDDVSLPVLPGVIPAMSAVFMVTRELSDDEKPNFVVSAGMSQFPLQSFPVAGDFQGKTRARTVVQMQGIPVMAPGTFRVELRLEGEERVLGSWDILIQAVASAVTKVASTVPDPPETLRQIS